MEEKEIIRLNVKTVPAFDSEIQMPHTAYTVSCMLEDTYAIASAWTLRDAVRLFRQRYDINEQAHIHLARPFRPQNFRR